MANMQDVLNGLNALTIALTTGLRSEKNHIPIHKFKGDNQDPVEWLRDFEVAATANGVTDIRKIQIVRWYLEGAAAACLIKELPIMLLHSLLGQILEMMNTTSNIALY